MKRQKNFTLSWIPAKARPCTRLIWGGMTCFFVTGITYLLTLGLSLPASAQTSRDQTQADLPELTVSAPEESKQAPSSFHEIIKPDRHPREITSLPELLDHATGTTVRSLGALGQFSTVSIRGSSAEQVGVYLDGVRLNTGGFGAVDLSTVPLAAVESIEIIRGGGTTIFGGDAVGGVINIISKTSKPGRFFEARAGGGSFLTLDSALSFHEQKKDRSFLISHAHQSSKGNYKFEQATTNLAGTTIGTGGTFSRDHNRSLTEALLVKFDRQTEENTLVTGSNDFFFADRQLPGLELEATQLAPTNPLEAKQRIFRNSSHFDVLFTDLGAKNLDLHLGIHNIFESGEFEDQSPALGSAIDRQSISNAASVYSRLAYFVPTSSGGHELTLRSDFRHDLFHDKGRNSTTTGAGLHQRNTYSALFQDDWEAYKDVIEVIPALRYSYSRDYSHNINARMGIVGHPTRPVSIKANVETTQRIPTFTELYHPDQGFIRGNANLDKEQAWHWDAGLSLNNEYVSAEAAYFQQYIKDSILFVPISAVTIEPVNTSKVKADGVETSLSVSPVKPLRISGNYTWLRANFRNTGKQLAGRPKHKVNGRIQLSGKIYRGLGGSIFSEVQWQDSTPLNVDNTVFIGSSTSIDAGARLTWTTQRKQEYFVSVEANDLTNVQIYDARGFPLPRRAIFARLGGKWH